MKVNELPYERVSAEEVVREIEACAAKAAAANGEAALKDARDAYLKPVFRFATMNSLSNARFTLDTRDPFYAAEHAYYDEASPAVQNAQVKFMRAFLNNPACRTGALINPLVARQYRLQVKCISDETVALSVEDNRLVTEYTKLMAETLYEFKGEKMPLSALRRYFTDPDRAARKAAYETAGRTLKSISDRLDDIYDRMVAVRDKTAKALGYENYVGLGDNRMGRVSYDRRMIAAFRENVRTGLVPVVTRLKNELKDRLGVDRFMLYDNDSYFACGNPAPVIDAAVMFRAGGEMYADMSRETGEFFDMMVKSDAFDVFPREGKWGGGYCTSFIDYRQPFILANFNGTSGDVDVLTHEAGHAFADYMMYRQGHDVELNVGGMETAETHSMSMEFFCWKYIDKFFGGRARDYKYMHLFSALTFIPYGTIVDYFQQLCYENPRMTPAERKALWNKLEGEFRPYLSAEGIPYLEEGTRWQYQMHVYENPLYYIDYCLAQTVALGFLLKSRDDYAAAFQAYLGLVKQGGEAEFPALVKEAGLKSPFDRGALNELAAQSEALLKSL